MKQLLLLIALTFFTSCSTTRSIEHQDPRVKQLDEKTLNLKLTSINIIDRNGLTETINAKERLKGFEEIDFFSNQSYQKVLRVYAKDKAGTTFSVITSYYPTGQIKQYLEVVNGRAHGKYIEWYPNGSIKLQADVLGGPPDIDEKSQSGWSFDNTSHIYSEDGHVLAEINYENGLLEKTSTYYHSNGQISETIPYQKGEIEGVVEVFATDGTLLEQTSYKNDEKDGESLGFYDAEKPSWKEIWKNGALVTGTYFDKHGDEIAHVEKGSGTRALFIDSWISELQEYKKGKPEGDVIIFNEKGEKTRKLQVKDGQKHGTEVIFWPQEDDESEPVQKLSIDWYQGKIQGTVKSWYRDGSQESQREMNNNKKHGVLMAWYKNGQLMMIEEYEKDRLMRGDYLKGGSSVPVTKIINGNGTATFYDQDGTFLRRVEYKDGKPVDDESSHPL